MQVLDYCPSCQSSNKKSFIQTQVQMHPSKEQFNFDRCQDCGLVFLNPRVELHDLKNYYTDYYLPYRGAKAWGRYEKFVASSQVRLDAKRIQLTKQFHQVSEDSLLLDIGCGKPTFLKAFVQQSNCRGMGIDFSAEGWQSDSGDFSELDLQVAEIKDLSPQIQPDIITMWHYLEHDYTPLENLTLLRECAKPTTTLLIEVPNFDSESRKKFGIHWAGWHTPRHTSLFTPSSMQTLLNNAGWRTKKLLSYGTLDPYVLYWMSKMEQENIAWDKNMEEEFVDFVKGMVAFLPTKWQQKLRSLGVMTAIAQTMS